VAGALTDGTNDYTWVHFLPVTNGIASELTILGLNEDSDRNILLTTAQGSTHGRENLWVGKDAGLGMYGTNNIGVGYSAGDASSGEGNAALGSEAFTYSEGNYNLILGAESGHNLFGNFNTAIGYNAGSTTTGSNNVSVGNQAGPNMTGSGNTSLGQNAGVALSGEDNVSISGNAGYCLVGTNNVSIGLGAGYYLEGSENILLGKTSGDSLSGNGNVVIGISAGVYFRGTNSILIGTSAGSSVDPYTNEYDRVTVIGEGAPMRGSNTMSLGASNDTVYVNGALRAYGAAHGQPATLADQWVTLQQLNNVAAREVTMYLHGSVASDIAGGKQMSVYANTSNSVSTTVNNTTNNQYVYTFYSPLGGMGLTEMIKGTYNINAQMRASGTGATGKWEVYLVNSNGVAYYECPDVEVLSIPTTQSKVNWRVIMATNATVNALTDRWMLRYKAVAANNRDLTLWTEGVTPATLSGAPSSGAELDPVWAAEKSLFLPMESGVATGLTSSNTTLTGTTKVGKIFDAAGTTEIYDTANGSMDGRYVNELSTPTTNSLVGFTTTTERQIRRMSWIDMHNDCADGFTNRILVADGTYLWGATTNSDVEIALLTNVVARPIYVTGAVPATLVAVWKLDSAGTAVSNDVPFAGIRAGEIWTKMVCSHAATNAPTAGGAIPGEWLFEVSSTAGSCALSFDLVTSGITGGEMATGRWLLDVRRSSGFPLTFYRNGWGSPVEQGGCFRGWTENNTLRMAVGYFPVRYPSAHYAGKDFIFDATIYSKGIMTLTPITNPTGW
jgi:hypothetical protein